MQNSEPPIIKNQSSLSATLPHPATQPAPSAKPLQMAVVVTSIHLWISEQRAITPHSDTQTYNGTTTNAAKVPRKLHITATNLKIVDPHLDPYP